jgi:2-dehydropantoate 2-reductase
MPLNREKGIKDIVVFGLGGVGGFFGGKIACRLDREKDETRGVFFVARGPHLEKIRKDGLVLNTADGNQMVCRPALATDNMEDIPRLDLCLICVKSYDLEGALRALGPKVGDDTVLLPLLNGVDVYERVKAGLSRGIVLPATVYVGTHIERPGVVTQQGGEGIILLGKDPCFPDFNPGRVTDFLSLMEIKFKWIDDPFPAIWEKYVFIAAFGLVTACSGKTLGEVASDSEWRKQTEGVMREIVRIAERRQIALPAGIVGDSLEKANNFPYETRTSYQRDIETKGNLNEGDLFGRTILRMGLELKVPTPVTRSLYSKIERRLGN